MRMRVQDVTGHEEAAVGVTEHSILKRAFIAFELNEIRQEAMPENATRACFHVGPFSRSLPMDARLSRSNFHGKNGRQEFLALPRRQLCHVSKQFSGAHVHQAYVSAQKQANTTILPAQPSI